MGKCTAVVKWFDHKKGFGFLINSDGQDVLVHHSDIQMDGYRQLSEKQQVEYLPVTKATGGLAAAEVVVLEVAE